MKYFQMNLWRVIESAVNSQTLTPSSHAKLKAGIDTCCKVLGETRYPDKNDIISMMVFLYSSYLEKSGKLPVDIAPVNVRINGWHARENRPSPEIEQLMTNLKMYMCDKLLPFTKGFLLHGSIATNDHTGFSDMDAAIIVRDEVLTNRKRLKELVERVASALKIVLKFDNLQHHGFFIIPESFLRCYPENYLPIDVFKHAKSLNEPFELELRPYGDINVARENCAAMARDICLVKLTRPGNLYEAKRLLSQFMLLPTLCLQSRGVFVYKKHSFEMVRKEFPESWWAMDEASQIRMDWIRPRSLFFKPLAATLPNPWIASTTYRKLDWRIPNWLSRKLTIRFYDGVAALAKRMVL